MGLLVHCDVVRSTLSFSFVRLSHSSPLSRLPLTWWGSACGRYDVFENVRDDEAAHWDTLVRLVQYESLEASEGCEVEEQLGVARE